MREDKEQDATEKIMTHGVRSAKEMILAAEAWRAKEKAEEHTFNKAHTEELAEVTSAMGMATKDPLVWLIEVTEESTYPNCPCKKE